MRCPGSPTTFFNRGARIPPAAADGRWSGVGRWVYGKCERVKRMWQILPGRGGRRACVLAAVASIVFVAGFAERRAGAVPPPKKGEGAAETAGGGFNYVAPASDEAAEA